MELLPVVHAEQTRLDAWYPKLQAEVEHARAMSDIEPPPSVEPIKHLVAVGALYSCGTIEREYASTMRNLFPDDYQRVVGALTYCVSIGIPVAKNVGISILNLNRAGEGNFLAAAGHADIVVVCDVCAVDKRLLGRTYTEIDSLFEDSDGARQAKEHHVPGVWHQAAKNFGARMIVTCAVGGSVTHNHFAPPPEQESEYILHHRDQKGWDNRSILVARNLLLHLKAKPV